MGNEIVVTGTSYSAKDSALTLLALLRRHLDQTLHDSIYLNQAQLFTLKSWLLKHAESMANGKAVWLEESDDGKLYKLVAAVGKTDEGESVVWHEPLPWPFPFINQSYKLDDETSL